MIMRVETVARIYDTDLSNRRGIILRTLDGDRRGIIGHRRVWPWQEVRLR
jgi:hypothetical protein